MSDMLVYYADRVYFGSVCLLILLGNIIHSVKVGLQ